MTYRRLLGLAILAATIPVSVQAQESGTYGAIGAATYDFDTYGVDLKLGHNFTENLGIEAQGIIGLTTDSILLSNATTSATLRQKTDYTIGLFAVGRIPLSEQFELFARGGIHHTRSGFTINNVLMTDFSSDDTGVAVGGGLQYNFSDRNGIRLETTYLDNFDSLASSISFVRKF